ncbi:jhy protein homolog [Apteryx mantelli]|uniref:Jhy protein homolog n=1 Tax=Apteryx mantelli TaxID=2696672 RepID=A0ABM4FME1_9AVES
MAEPLPHSNVNSSHRKYISVSSPHTCNMIKSHFPGRVFMQPHFYPENLKRQSVSEGDLAAGLHDSEESDCESLAQERQYQLELQQRIRENEELIGLSSDELENDSLEEDSLAETSLKEHEEAKCDTDRYTTGMQKNGSNGRKEQSVDKYFNLRYDPNWKNIKEVTEFSEAKKAHQVPGRGSVEFSQDSFYLLADGCPEEKNQQMTKSQDTSSEFDTEVLNFHEPNAMISNEPCRLYVKGKESEEDYHFRDSPSTYSSAFSLRIHDQPERAKKDFVAKNKQTLGLSTRMRNSYLQLHSKKQGEVLQEKVADTKAVDEEPVQNVLPFQNMKLDPEDKWYLKSQQLKDHQNKQPQRNKIKSNQSLKGRAFPRNDSQQPPGRPAESKSWHHRHLQVSEFQTAPTQAAEQDNSSALQKWPCPNLSIGPGATHLNNFPNSKHFVNQDFKHHHGPPNGLPHDQQHLYNHAILPFFPRDDCTNDQAHPNQRNNSSIYNANFQELVKDQVSLQDCKRRIYADKSYPNYAISILWPSHSSTHSSPAAPCPASQLMKTMEQHYQEITHLTEAHLADRHLFSLLPPIIPQLESGSELHTERGERSQVKISRSNSEGYLMQLEKQKQLKVNKKPYSSKAYMNLNVRLGGLGPDYEAIKEKKEKLKQQKEYAKQIKEHNMKNIASVQRLPTKPKVTSSVSRQKALEYAKKIRRPKTFATRQPDEEVKDERVPSQISRRDHLPQIASLETLQDRHEKEKQVVAAFRTLHIL